jgi:hypothetical protein
MSVRTVYPEGRPKQVRPNLGRRLLGKKLAGRLRSFNLERRRRLQHGRSVLAHHLKEFLRPSESREFQRRDLRAPRRRQRRDLRRWRHPSPPGCAVCSCSIKAARNSAIGLHAAPSAIASSAWQSALSARQGQERPRVEAFPHVGSPPLRDAYWCEYAHRYSRMLRAACLRGTPSLHR